jgi:hypothetical protein
MGHLRKLIKTGVKVAEVGAKVVAAPVYVPLKLAESLRKPSTYNYWVHDGGQGTDAGGQESNPDNSASNGNQDNSSAGT